METRARALEQALRELTAMVRGECPSLLNEDSGGNGELSYEIDTLLASPLSAPPQVDVVALARAYRALVEHVAEQQATPDESWRAQADSLDRMLELEAALTKVALDKAKRRALTIFDTWLRVTGAIPAGSSWVCEAESCIEDAVEIGVQAAYGIHRPLESESDAAPPQEPTGASPQAETRRDCTCLGTCRGAEGLGPRWKCALETPAPVSPVEPPPEPPVGSEAWRQGSSVRPIMTASSNTPAAPETCEWRESESGLYADSGCRQSEFFEVVSVEEWKVCPYCLKPLRLVPSEETK